jgi:carboxyl-terminal processing protease
MVKLGKKALEVIIAIVAAAALLGSGFWLGWGLGRKVPKNIVVTGAANMGAPTSTIADFNTFWQAWQAINDNYLRNGSTTNEDKMYGAVNGLVGSLNDPYSAFFTPEGNKQFQEDITGNFGGVGAQLGVDKSGHLVIIAPLKGTPAESAGLKAQDWIVAVNGTSTEGLAVDEAVTLIRGPEGSTVTLTIMRDGWEKSKDFKLVRANIKVPSVDFEMKGEIAHISLHEFTQDADQAFYNALTQAVDANAKGIVLDLRDDPGGYLEVAVDIAGYFLKPGSPVVKEVGRTAPEQDFKASGNGALANMPIDVLINGGSASASEILAGALHDVRGAKLIGETSFGKGTVQELEPLADGSALKLTVAHWVLPSGRILDHDGLTPDYEVKLSDADVLSHRDPQLDKAIAIVQAEIGK